LSANMNAPLFLRQSCRGHRISSPSCGIWRMPRQAGEGGTGRGRSRSMRSSQGRGAGEAGGTAAEAEVRVFRNVTSACMCVVVDFGRCDCAGGMYVDKTAAKADVPVALSPCSAAWLTPPLSLAWLDGMPTAPRVPNFMEAFLHPDHLHQAQQVSSTPLPLWKTHRLCPVLA
jgi:hypothetical protein